LPDPEDDPAAAEDRALDDDGGGEAPGDPTADAEEGPPVAPLTRDDLASPTAGRIGPLVLAGVALLLVGFIVGRVTADEDGTEEATTSTAAPALQFPSGDQDRANYWGFGGVTPAIKDSFSRDDSSDGLGTTETGEQWQTVNGSWQLVDGLAAAGEGGGGRPSIVVVRGGQAERLTEATAVNVEEGAGLVFRYRDADNFWSLTASPGNGTWIATRVVDGQPTVVAEIPATTADGTTVTVAQRGPELQILVEGVEAIRVTDPALVSQRSSGLIAPGDGDGSARFDRFYVGNMPV